MKRCLFGFVDNEYDCTAFLRDFVAAVNKDGNPRAVFQ
jgi:hypothetical protein